MPEAYIVDAARTPVGKRGGGLSQVHPADLGAHVIKTLVERNDLDPMAVEDVFFGCVDAIGPQAGDIARTCWLAAGLPEEVPGTTIDRQCGSSQQAVHFAAQAVMSGTNDVIMAGGVQNMSMIPISSAMLVAEQFGFTDPFSTSEGWVARYGTQEVSQFRGAEMIAEKWGVTREEMEAFAIESHERALRAQREGRFELEIVPLEGVTADEGPREPNLEKIRSLKPLVEGGRLTAARGQPDLRCRHRDARRVRARAEGAQPHAAGAHPPPLGARRRPDLHAHGADPGDGLRAREVRDDARRHRPHRDQRGVRVGGARVAAGDRAPTSSKVNVNGGAIALGHPLGATGVRLMTTLLNELERTGGRYGLQTMCEGGGQANVTIIERL